MNGWTMRSDGLLNALAAAGFLVLGPLAALVPRGLPVWTIAMGLVAAALVIRREGAPGLLPDRGPTTWIATGFLTLSAIGTAWSPSPRAFATAAEILYEALGVLIIGRWIAGLSAEKARYLGSLFLGGLAVGLAAMVVNTTFRYPLNYWWHDLPDTAPVVETNVPKRTAAAFALLVWPAAMMIEARAAWWVGVALPLAYAAGAGATGSRSAQFGMAAGLIVWGLARISATAVRRGLAVVLVAAFVVVVPLARYMVNDAHLETSDWLVASAQHRVEIWARAANRIPDALFLGHGIDASRAIQPRSGEASRFETLKDSLFPLHPHNAFLQLWLELGAVGGALAVGLALSVLAVTRRLRRETQALALGLFATGLFMANTAYGLWQAWWMTGYVAVGLLSALAARAEADGADD